MNSAPASGHRTTAIFQGLLIAFLWSTSWVLIKFGLVEIPPVVFAGVRYFLAFLILLLAFLLSTRRQPAASLPRPMWRRLIIVGLLQYAIAQGAMFVALDHLPAVTVNLLLNFTTLGVALISAGWLAEKPSLLQWGGILLALVGALVYFYPAAIPRAQWIGLLAAAVCVTANVLGVIVGRDSNRSLQHPPLQVTVVSMGAGATALLAAGLLLEGLPSISPRNWLFILWLAAVNTAFAYTLWNHTLRTLTATESSIITGTMLVWIPILAVIFLGEHVGPKELLGLIAVGLGTLFVQLRGRRKAA
jgi:drug/metabolite transporter (DMT)-like permease